MEFVSSIDDGGCQQDHIDDVRFQEQPSPYTQDSVPIKGVIGPFKKFPGNWQSSNDEFVSSIYEVILEIHSSWKTRK